MKKGEFWKIKIKRISRWGPFFFLSFFLDFVCGYEYRPAGQEVGNRATTLVFFFVGYLFRLFSGLDNSWTHWCYTLRQYWCIFLLRLTLTRYSTLLGLFPLFFFLCARSYRAGTESPWKGGGCVLHQRTERDGRIRRVDCILCAALPPPTSNNNNNMFGISERSIRHSSYRYRQVRSIDCVQHLWMPHRKRKRNFLLPFKKKLAVRKLWEEQMRNVILLQFRSGGMPWERKLD